MSEKVLHALVTTTEVRYTGGHFAKVFCPVCGAIHAYELGPIDRLNECMAPENRPANFVFRKAVCNPEWGLFLMPPQYVFSDRNKRRVSAKKKKEAA